MSIYDLADALERTLTK